MKTATQQGLSTKLAVRLLFLSFALVLVSCLGASALQTDFGKVSIIDFKIPTDNGKWIAGNLYKPVTATADNKVPLVITCHGYLNNNEMQDSTAIELSRRGIAVLAMDAYFHGDSSSSQVNVIESVMAEGTGMVPMVEFAYTSLDYVDNSRIGIMGHSMGGMDVWLTLANYGGQYKAALAAAALPDSPGGSPVTAEELAAARALNKVSAGLASGNARLSTAELFQSIDANVAINYGRYDEGCYDLTRGNGDLSGDSAEALAAINSVLPEGERVGTVEPGKLYGTAADHTLRVVYNPPATHQQQHFSLQSTADNVEFFAASFEQPLTIPPTSQLWLYKELFNALGLVGVFLAILPLATLLLRVPAFASLRQPLPAPQSALVTSRAKLLFYGGWILSWVVSWISFMPTTMLDTKLFPGTAAMGFGGWLPQQTSNFLMLWAVFNGVVGLLLFYGYRRLAVPQDRASAMQGIRTTLPELGKTLALATCLFGAFYGFVALAEYFFNTDFRLWFVALCTAPAKIFLVGLRYLPFYFVFFAANAILTNCVNRVAGQREWLNLLLCGLGNVLGIVALNAVQYVTLFSSGAAFWQATRLYPLLAIPLVPQLFVAAYLNRYLYKETGKVWLGAMVNCLVIVMMGALNTATLLPL